MATVWGAASRTAPERQRSFSSPAWAAVRRSTTRGRWRSAIAVFFRSDFNAKKKVRRSYQNLTAPSDAKVFIHTSSAAAAARRGAEGLRHRGLPHGPPAQALLRHDHARVGRDGAGGFNRSWPGAHGPRVPDDRGQTCPDIPPPHRCRPLARRRAWGTRCTGVAGIAGVTGVASCASVASCPGVAGVTRRTGITGVTRCARVSCAAGVPGIPGIPGVTRCTLRSGRTRLIASAEREHEQ